MFHARTNEEKALKSDMLAVQLQCDKVKRENARLETKVIPELERQLDI